MASPAPERGDTTRTAILAAALELFLRQGYHGTTMRQIATVAGVVPGAVYNHFSGKEDIYQTLLAEANLYPLIGEALQMASGETVELLLRDGARRLLAALRSRNDIIPLIFVDVLEFDARNIVSYSASAVSGIVAFFGRVASLGATSGELKPVRPDLLARAFLGLFASYFITTRFFSRVLSQYPGLDVSANVTDDFVRIFCYGVLRQQPLSSSSPTASASDIILPPQGG